MMKNHRTHMQSARGAGRRDERGAALALAVMVLLLITVVSISVLAIVGTEGGIAGSDLQRTRAFYAAQTSIERMTNEFSGLFVRTTTPTAADLDRIEANYPIELIGDGFFFTQSLEQQGNRRSVVIPNGQFAGLNASVIPYVLTATAKMSRTDTEVTLQRNINNYLVPLFQFGLFSDEDIELHPGPPFYFNGRVHANGNLYLNGDTTFLSKVTTANEVVTSVLRNGFARAPNVKVNVGNTQVQMTLGSVSGGPNLPAAQRIAGRGIFPLHPNGTANTNWESVSVAAATGANNQFGGQVLTRTTGAKPLLLPLQLGGAPTRELIKRRLPNEDVANPVLSQSRYHSKAGIRILLDDENPVGVDGSGIPAGRGVALSTFVPTALGGGRPLARYNDNGTVVAADVTEPTRQKLDPTPAAGATPTPTPRLQAATTVRTSQSNPIYNVSGNASSGVSIPQGAGLRGRILIEIVPAGGGAPVDVTQAILSMGITEGEPNGIVYLQRPMWAAFTQGSRDRIAANRTNLVYLTDSLSPTAPHATRAIIDGEINTAAFALDATFGYYTVANNLLDDDPHAVANPFMPTGGPVRDAFPCPAATPACVNRIVPINLYNVREGAINTGLLVDQVYERGIMSVVEINMRNLARWFAGTYDANLLAGTPAVSANIDAPDGYILYISDRRGDRVRNQGGFTVTNGIVDNEDIYGPNGALDPGEDVNGDGVLSNDQTELPSPAAFSAGNIYTRAQNVAAWTNLDPGDPSGLRSRFFRRAVRLFNAETLQVDGPGTDLTTTRGITIASENMVYFWGNYNTTGITAQPAGGSTLNNGGYTGAQIPSSIVADAFTPLSKTWFDSSSALYPQGGRRPADAILPGITESTSIRTGIIAGNNMSALAGDPSAGNGGATDERRLSGGLHNYPRFLEDWSGIRWNFVGSLIPLFRSTQAVGPYNANGAIYGAPNRNWAFDITFTDPERLPPGTPVFQYIEPTGFRQLLR